MARVSKHNLPVNSHVIYMSGLLMSGRVVMSTSGCHFELREPPVEFRDCCDDSHPATRTMFIAERLTHTDPTHTENPKSKRQHTHSYQSDLVMHNMDYRLKGHSVECCNSFGMLHAGQI